MAETLFTPGVFTDLTQPQQVHNLNLLLQDMLDRLNTLDAGTITATELADNAVTNAKVADNAINTAEIVNNAVTNTAYATTAAAETVEAEESIQTVTLTTNGGLAFIVGHFSVAGSGGAGNATVTGRLRKGTIAGTIISTAVVGVSNAAPDANSEIFLLARDTTPAASQQYTMSAEDSSGAAAPVVDCSERTLLAVNLKK